MFPRRVALPVALLATLALTAPLTAQSVQAHYPLLTDLLDATGSYGPVLLSGNPTPPGMPANGVCVNGIYSYNSGGQDVRTPNLSTLTMNDFQFEVEFNLASLPGLRAPVLMGGHLYRWLGIYVDANGTAGLKHNNSNLAWSTTTLTTGRWYSAAVKYEGGTAQLFLDGALILQVAVGPLNDGNNLNFTTNDFSTGLNHNGCIRNLRISNDANLAFHRVPTGCGAVTFTEGGNAAAGGNVSFTIGGSFATSAIMFGFAPAQVPLCPNSSCVIGLVQAGALPGPNLALAIPPATPAGATVAFQGVAIATGGCSFGGGLDVALTDTIHVVIQ